MNTIEINKALSTNMLTSHTYVGCFAADQIPAPPQHHIQYPRCMVVNLDPRGQKGSHWVSLYFPAPGQVEYYDPLGVWPPLSEHIQNHLSENYTHVKYNTLPLQSPYSRACGRHAIFFLYARCLGAPFERIVQTLHSSKAPDMVVNEFIRKVIFHI